MTLSLPGAARGIQLLGLVTVLTGVAATVLAPFCGSSIWSTAGLFGSGLDAYLLTTRRRFGILPVSILQLLVVLAPILVLVSCGYVSLPPPPIPVDLGPNLIMLSGAVSLLGAILRLPAR